MGLPLEKAQKWAKECRGVGTPHKDVIQRFFQMVGVCEMLVAFAWGSRSMSRVLLEASQAKSQVDSRCGFPFASFLVGYCR